MSLNYIHLSLLTILYDEPNMSLSNELEVRFFKPWCTFVDVGQHDIYIYIYICSNPVRWYQWFLPPAHDADGWWSFVCQSSTRQFLRDLLCGGCGDVLSSNAGGRVWNNRLDGGTNLIIYNRYSHWHNNSCGGAVLVLLSRFQLHLVWSWDKKINVNFCQCLYTTFRFNHNYTIALGRYDNGRALQ